MKPKESPVNIIEILKKKKPKTADALVRCLKTGLTLIGRGVYRQVFRIDGTDYVVKIPCCKEGIEHSQSEYNACCAILGARKYRVLWKYMPHFFYYDEDRGILVMPYYYPIDTGTRQAEKRGEAISLVMCDLVKLVWKKNQGRVIDLHTGNIGLTKNGEPIIIDMGYFYGPPEEDDEKRPGS